MRLPDLRAGLPWFIGVSLIAGVGCLSLAVYLGVAARDSATRAELRAVAAQADVLARQTDADLALLDLALADASYQAPTTPQISYRPAVPELRLTARYVSFINILNEAGDVIADPRPNVSRPANFASRDYFQYHLKNAADVMFIGRPFGVAPDQRPAVTISRRLNRPDGSFAGVVVAGLRLSWLQDLLSRPLPGPHTSVTIRSEDGVILALTPYDAAAIARSSDTDPNWTQWLRTGLDSIQDKAGDVRFYRRLGTPPWVLELTLDAADIAQSERSSLTNLPPLVLLPGLCVLGLSLLAYRLQRRINQIEAAARQEKDNHKRLIATLNHELGTPLTGILGQAELMKDAGGLDEYQAGRLARLTEAASLMRHIVERVTDSVRLSGGEAIVPVPCNVDQLVRGCIGIVEAEATRKGLELTSHVDLNVPGTVMLPADEVRQVLLNLLRNAVKFTAQGTVTSRVSGDAKQLRFEIADTGPGIPRAKRRRLFQEYDRLDNTKVEGSGLGLSIVRRLVLAMGGRVGHMDNLAGGSVFWVELPTCVPDPAVRSQPLALAPDSERPRLNILLADDLVMTRGVTADMLRSAGHAVTEVEDGEAAVAAVKARDFDVVLTDMRMPVVDGLQATKRIRALPGHRGRTPVVLVTADLDALERGESYQTGIDVCLKKPFRKRELLAAVAQAARLKPVPGGVTGVGPALVPETRAEAGAEASPHDETILNFAALAELWSTLGPDQANAFLDAAASRIEDFMALLDRTDATESQEVRGAAHDLIGVCGLLGIAILPPCLRRFDAAQTRAAAADELREACPKAAEALRRQRERWPP